jgi:hypothetical protein
MSDLYLPPHIIREQRQKFDAAIWRNVTAQDPLAQQYTVLIQRMAPGAAIVKAHDTIYDPVPLRPGFYHLLQKPIDAATQVTVLESGDGGYAEPGDWIFDCLARGNLRERRVRDRLAEQERVADEAAAKAMRTTNEQRKERLKDIVLSATRAQVSMDRTIPWTQNSQGRRER